MMRFATSRTLSALLMSLAIGGASLGCKGPEPEYPSTPVARPFKKSRRQPKMPETASETEKPEGIAADEVPGEFLPKAVFPTCTMAANAPLQEFWLALQFEGKDTVEGVARGLAPVGCLLAPTLSELRTREPELAGVEGFVDEQPTHWFGAGMLVELEPRASFGADVRYLLRFRDNMFLHAGATAVLAPDNLIGATVGYAYRLTLAKGVELNVNPLVNVFFLGGDLPKDTAIWQGTLSLGARLGLF